MITWFCVSSGAYSDYELSFLGWHGERTDAEFKADFEVASRRALKPLKEKELEWVNCHDVLDALVEQMVLMYYHMMGSRVGVSVGWDYGSGECMDSGDLPDDVAKELGIINDAAMKRWRKEGERQDD